MSNLPSSASEAQMIDLFQNFKMPIMGAGGGFAPIGTINFFDASIAPQGWLACDGSVVNIADYPELATYYASVHGSSNFYGGNGTTTFAVPDLRGEFLRGTGTNSHTNQGSGSNVGVHQDATQHNIMYQGSSQVVYIQDPDDSNKQFCANPDSRISINGTYIPFNRGGSGTSTGYPLITSRPTNTSFLICVKATVAGDANAHVYSTDEQVVGMDENGSTIYEKTVNELSATLSNSNWVTVTSKNSVSNKLDKIISAKLYCKSSGNSTLIYTSTQVISGNIQCFVFGMEGTSVKGITIQYTKTS